MMEESWTPDELARAYLARGDWRRSRAPGPPPRTGTLSLWDGWIRDDPERAWPLFEAFLRLRPEDVEVVEQVWRRLQHLLERHGEAYEERVRALVAGNALLHRIAPPARLDPAAYRPAPLDVEALVDAYLDVLEYGHRASGVDNLVRGNPEEALPLVLEIIERGPLHGFTSGDTNHPLRELLRQHGPRVIDGVEEAAARSVLVRRVLWRAARYQRHPPDEYDMAPDVWERVHRAAAGTTDYDTDDPPGSARPLLPDDERTLQSWFRHEAAFWAYMKLGDLVTEDPETAWSVILRVVERAGTDDQLGSLGAGPLEDLIRLHGVVFIDRIEERARHDERFRDTLRAVWRTETPEALWARVEAARGTG